MKYNDKSRIFLCHASEDKQQVLSIYKKLKATGFNPWLDTKDLLPGHDWDKEIKRAIKNSRLILVFFSNHSVSKWGYVQREFKLVLDTLDEIPEDQIFVIPARLDECMIPESFRYLQYVDLFEEGGLDKIIKVIDEELGNIFVDPRDGKTYKTVRINGNIWMAENLNYNSRESCWFYQDEPKNGNKYGRLYTWESAQLACPPGCRMPTDEDWEELALHFGGYINEKQNIRYGGYTSKTIGDPRKAYYALIEGGHSRFDANCSGGYRNSEGSFLSISSEGYYWSDSVIDEKTAWSYGFFLYGRDVRRLNFYKTFGLSCRCIIGEKESSS